MEPAINSASLLVGTALAIGVGHTAIGIDHSLPFIMLSRARGWSMLRTLAITALCGLGHVASSIVLGAVGLALGVAVERLEWLESTRGDLSAWLLIGFGVVYAAWGVRRARRGSHHSHLHVHADGTIHRHPHAHETSDHVVHVHEHLQGQEPSSKELEGEGRRGGTRLAPAGPVVVALFVIFVLGPCEALIPLLMVPAFAADWLLLVTVVGVFAVATIGTMLAVVAAGVWGLRFSRFELLERHLHTLAGATIALSGLGVRFLGI